MIGGIVEAAIWYVMIYALMVVNAYLVRLIVNVVKIPPPSQFASGKQELVWNVPATICLTAFPAKVVSTAHVNCV